MRQSSGLHDNCLLAMCNSCVTTPTNSTQQHFCGSSHLSPARPKAWQTLFKAMRKVHVPENSTFACIRVSRKNAFSKTTDHPQQIRVGISVAFSKDHTHCEGATGSCEGLLGFKKCLFLEKSAFLHVRETLLQPNIFHMDFPRHALCTICKIYIFSKSINRLGPNELMYLELSRFEGPKSIHCFGH